MFTFRPKSAGWALLLLTAATWAVFAPSLTDPFLSSWDDPAHVTRNVHLALTWSNFAYWWHHAMLSIYMPVTMFTYMIDHAVWGLNPLGYRLQTLCWHTVAVLALWGCCRRLGVKTLPATLAALCWAIHPQRVESVVWMSERKDVLCAAFYFLSLYWYLGGRDRNRFNGPAWLAFVLALLSKPMAVSLPLVILCVEFYRRRDGNWRFYLRLLWPWLLAAAAVMTITMNLQVVEKNRAPDWSRIGWVTAYNVYWYVKTTLLPLDLSPVYPRWIGTPGLFGELTGFYLLALGMGYWLWRRGHDRLYFCGLPVTAAFLAAVAPVAAMLHAGYIDHADRYSYIPSAFLWFAAAWGWQWLAVRVGDCRWQRWLLVLVPLSYAGALAAMTVDYLPCWRSFYDLVRSDSQRQHPHYLMLCEWGLLENDRRNFEQTIPIAERLEHEFRPGTSPEELQSRRVYADYFRAVALFHRGQMAESERLFLTLFRQSRPDSFYKNGFYTQVVMSLFWLRVGHHDVPGALQYAELLRKEYERTGDIHGFSYYFYRGLQAMLEKRDEEARSWLERARQLEPDDPACRENLMSVQKRLLEKKVQQ